MRVLQIHNRYRDPGGEDISVANDRRALEEAGIEVIPFEDANPDGAIAAAGRMLRATNNRAAARRVARVIEAEKPDIAHVHNTWFSLTPSVVRECARHGLPVVMSLRNYRLTCANAVLFRNGAPCELCVGGSKVNGVRYRCYRGSAVQSAIAAATITRTTGRVFARNVRTFIALTEFSAAVHERAGLPADQIVVRSNFVEDPGPRQLPPSASDTFLYAGRLTAEKGVEPLVRAWSATESTGLRLKIVGGGPMRARLEAIGGAEIEWIPHLDHQSVIAAMREARALVFPSLWYEGQGRSMLEAFACGLPVLASDLGSARETVEPLGTAWLAPPGDVREWTSRLDALADDSTVDEAGARAREVYEHRYTPRVATRSLLEIYDAALAGPTRAST